MSLREQEKAWQRRRRFVRWDHRGGPHRISLFAYRHRSVAIGFVALLVVGLPLLPFLLAADGRVPLHLIGWGLVVTGVLGWQLGISRELHAEWQAYRARHPRPGPLPPGRPDPSAGGWLSRVDRRNQAAMEMHREAGWDEPHTSPAADRFFLLWAAYLGVGIMATVVIALLDRVVGGGGG